MAQRKLEVVVAGDTTGLERALKRSGTATQRFGRNAGRSNNALAKSFAAVGKVAKVGGIAIAAGMAVGLKKMYEEAAEARKVTAQTEAVIKSTGGAANVTAKQIADLSTSISNKTAVDDEQIQSSANLLLTFTKVRNEAGKGNDIFNQSVAVITDMSAALGQDGKASAIQLGKALNDPIKGITALSRVGVSFTKGQKDQIKTLVEHNDLVSAQKIILGELTKEFGGSAKAAATPLQKLKVTLDNIAETLGTALLPYLDRAALAVSGFIGEMQSGEGAGGRFVNVLSGIASTVGPPLAAAAGAVRTFIGQIVSGEGAGGRLRTAVVNAFNAIRGVATVVAAAIAGVAPTIGSVALKFVEFAAHVASSRAGIIALTAIVGALTGRLVALGIAFAVGKIQAFISVIMGLRDAFLAARAGIIALNAAALTTGLGALLVVAGAVIGALIGFSSSSKRAATSVRDVTDAVNKQREALKRLNDLDIEAKQRKVDLSNANTRVARAEQNLRQMRKSGTASALDLKDAENELRAARLDQTRASRNANRTEGDAEQVRREAVNSLEDEISTRKGRIKTIGGEIVQMVKQGASSDEMRAKIQEATREQQALNRAIDRLKSKKITIQVQTQLSGPGVAKAFNQVFGKGKIAAGGLRKAGELFGTEGDIRDAQAEAESTQAGFDAADAQAHFNAVSKVAGRKLPKVPKAGKSEKSKKANAKAKEERQKIIEARRELKELNKELDRTDTLADIDFKIRGLEQAKAFADTMKEIRTNIGSAVVTARDKFIDDRLKRETAAIEGSAEAQRLADLQGQERADSRAQQDKDIADKRAAAQKALALAEAKQNPKLIAEAKAALADVDQEAASLQRSREIEALETSLQNQRDASAQKADIAREGNDAETNAYVDNLNAQLGALATSLEQRTTSYKDYVAAVRAILGDLAPEASADQEAVITAPAPGAPPKVTGRKKKKVKARRRASGGIVLAGHPYRVGEVGPETFVPGVKGRIVPASMGGGRAGGVVINMNGTIRMGSTRDIHVLGNRLAFKVLTSAG